MIRSSRILCFVGWPIQALCSAPPCAELDASCQLPVRSESLLQMPTDGTRPKSVVLADSRSLGRQLVQRKPPHGNLSNEENPPEFMQGKNESEVIGADEVPLFEEVILGQSTSPLLSDPTNRSFHEIGYWSKAWLESVEGEPIRLLSLSSPRTWWNEMGFNMAIATLPDSMKHSSPTGATFVSYSRMDYWGNQCVHFGRDMLVKSHCGAMLRVHDRDFKVLAYGLYQDTHAAIDCGGGVDMRLLTVNDELWFSFVTGVGKLRLTWTSNVRFVAHPYDIVFTGGKNEGLIHNSNRVYVLDWVDPLTVSTLGPHYALNPNISSDEHNSMHPLYIPEKNVYLLAGHAHLDLEHRGIWHSFYVQHFYIMSATYPFKLLRKSKPFAFKAADGRDDVEVIQIISSMIRPDANSDLLLISYGLNDCTSVVTELKLSDVFALIDDESGHDALGPL